MVEQFDIEGEIRALQDARALRVIGYLLEQIRVLQEKVARLEKNSTNSSAWEFIRQAVYAKNFAAAYPSLLPV
jgi:hypothetical protein